MAQFVALQDAALQHLTQLAALPKIDDAEAPKIAAPPLPPALQAARRPLQGSPRELARLAALPREESPFKKIVIWHGQEESETSARSQSIQLYPGSFVSNTWRAPQ